MSEKLAAWAEAKKATARKSVPRRDDRSPQERKALRTLRREAREHGATLATGGEGGLPSSLVLGVMRRDGYSCKACGGQENLELHHKSEHLHDPKAQQRSRFLRERGKVDSPANIATICGSCHDRIHNKDRKENV